MYKSQAEAVRDWLKAYKQNESHIDKLLEEIRELRAHMMDIGAQELSDMPRPPSAPKDRMAEYMVQLDSKERSVRYCIKVQDECKKALIGMIALLGTKKEQEIIRLRYLYGYEWSDIVRELYKDEKEWPEKINTYTRGVYRLHDKALNDLAKKWIPDGGCWDDKNKKKKNDL